MKNKFNYLIKLFSITLVLFLLGCESQEEIVESHNHLKINAKILTGKEAEEAAEKLKSLFPSKIDKHNSNNLNQELATSFGTVDYSKVSVIENEDGTIKYAFNIIDDDFENNEFSNLILTEDGSYNTVKIAKYCMTDSFADSYYSGEKNISEFDGSLSQTTVMSDNPCTPQDDTISIGGTGGGGSGTGGTGSGGSGTSGGSGGGSSGGTMSIVCNNCNRSYGTFSDWRSSICANYDVTVYVSFSSTTSEVESNPCDDNNPLPILSLGEEAIQLRDFFRNELNAEQRDFLSNNFDVRLQINEFIITNDFSVESKEFAKEMIDFCNENDATFVIDDNVTEDNALVFDNVEEFQDYLNSNDDVVGNEFELIQEGEQKIASTKFEYPTYSIKAEIKQQLTPTYNLISVNSYKTGITFLLTWNQTNYATSITSSTATIDLYGTIEYGVKIGSFDGLTVTVDVHYQIVVNKSTGEIISANQIP